MRKINAVGFCSLLLLSIFSIFLPTAGLCTPSIDSDSIYPSAITVSSQAAVTVSVEILDPSLIPNSGSLQRLDENGKVTAILGNLHDDGLNGDLVAGDNRFSIQIPVTEQYNYKEKFSNFQS